MKISVLTPTVRKNGLDIVEKSLLKQSFKDWEWLIGSNFDPKIEVAKWNEDEKHWTQNSLATHQIKWVIDDFKGGYWSLNRIYNKMIKEAVGELIISLQDNIFIPNDALEKMWVNYQNTKGIISGVGNQYEKMGKYRPEICIWQDPRKHISRDSFYEIYPSDVEWNFCAVSRKALYNVGGFCERLDWVGFGMDGYQVNERLDLLGYKFYIDQTCESYTISHDRSVYGGEKNWNKNNNLSNGGYQKVRQEFINKSEWPKMNYLS